MFATAVSGTLPSKPDGAPVPPVVLIGTKPFAPAAGTPESGGRLTANSLSEAYVRRWLAGDSRMMGN